MTAIDRRTLAAIFAGGFAGAVLRGAMSETFTHRPAQWPWATFVVNVAGALVLGAAAAWVRRRRPGGPQSYMLVGVGFCGALTTFSALALELLRMIDEGAWGLAIAYTSASVAAGLAAVAAGGLAGACAAARRRGSP